MWKTRSIYWHVLQRLHVVNVTRASFSDFSPCAAQVSVHPKRGAARWEIPARRRLNVTPDCSVTTNPFHLDFFLNNQPDALILQIYSVKKLCMFQAFSLPIRPDSVWKRSSETCMKLTSAECTVENSWWWAEKMPETCRVLLLLLLVFSPWAGLGRDQSSVRRLVWLWYAASWASS